MFDAKLREMSEINEVYLFFEKSARLYPETPCLWSKSVALTYRQVEEKVLKLYYTILRDAPKEDIIGVPTTRGIDQIIMVLAILKAGKAYLPIDFGYLKSRIRAIINNSDLKVCLTTIADKDAVKAVGLQMLPTDDLEVAIKPKPQKSLAGNVTYILYTSGSTGEPKGVCMGQDAMINLISCQKQNSNAAKGTRTLQFAPLSFDVSFQEIMATFSTGGTLMLIDETLRLDMAALLNLIEEQSINRLFLPFVALQALAEAAITTKQFPDSLEEIMTAGEQLKITSQLRKFFSRLDNCVLYNQYGPTECHVVSELRLQGDPEAWPELPSIGKPIKNTAIFILDRNQKEIPDGEVGEICISGMCLAEGYLGNKKLTNEKFIEWESLNSGKLRIYRTGDMARYLPDGNIEFLGREDDQVKISGHRIELAEVELALSALPGIKQAVVIASNHLAGQTQLVAYLQSNNPSREITDFRKHASTVLPNFMLPAHYVLVQDFPRTSSGKIDKKALSPPHYERPSSAPLYKKPATTTQKNLTKTWSKILQISKIGIDDNFFEIGGTSLLAQKTVAILQRKHGYKVPITKLYQFPTIAGLAIFLDLEKEMGTAPSDDINETSNPSNETSNLSGDVAIIGMAGRFPGASSIQELWEILRNGKETISFFTKEELDASIPESLRNDPLYVRARGIVPSVKEFDASFFGLNPKVASAMDPQQRLFLEIAWEALEQAGHLSSHYKGSIGVYAGTGTNTYFRNNLLPNRELLDQVGRFQVNTLNEKDYVASRTAYHLNLKGPAVSVQSACSTSLLAIAEAVEAIRNGHCDVALAGGSSITAPVYSGHLYQEGSMLSSNGHCRSFDAEGKGTVFSDGAGVVLLKSLDAAQKNGDIIYGLIKGIGLNNDGGNKGSFTAPSAEGQAGSIRNALRDAQISPSTISYVEAHGTATPIGDPIEIEGLKMAFGEQKDIGYCALGSVKSNMGHLTAAAGVAGLIKTVLAMHHKQIPPSLGYSVPNPVIDLENSPFYVNQKLRDWNVDGPRRAGISSFGVGGTNVHVVVEEYENKPTFSTFDRPVQILAWSAKSEKSLEAYGSALGNYIEKAPSGTLADIAYSLNVTRESFNHRHFVLANTANEAVRGVTEKDNNLAKRARLSATPNELVFLFPGQGAQYLQMGRTLYRHEKVFYEAVDTCAELLMDVLKLDIREILFPDKITATAEKRLRDTRFTQPSLFIIEYALSQLWMSWGIKPTLFCGHSIGEFVAAHLAGIFSLKDGLHLVSMRGRLISELPTGSMLSIRMVANRVEELLPNGLSIAAINSDLLCVVSGPDKDIGDFAKILEERDVPVRLLSTSHAFHSAMMDPVLKAFEEEVGRIHLNPPQLPLISTVTGKRLTETDATNPKYWASHLRETVRFSDAMDTILELEDPLLLEVGPGQGLITLARQKKAAKSATTLSSLPGPKNDKDDYSVLLNTLGLLWVKGLEPDWHVFYAGQSRQKVWLPAYIFDRKPCWVNPLELPLSQQTSNPDAKVEEFIEKENNNSHVMRKSILLQKISEIITNTSGIELKASDFNYNFLELGLDSLILTQLALSLKKEFKIPITFRQLNEESGTPELLADYIDQNLAAEKYSPKKEKVPVQSLDAITKSLSPDSEFANAQNQNSVIDLIAQQIKLLGRQIELLQNNGAVSMQTITNGNTLENPGLATELQLNGLTMEEKQEHKKPFGASPRIERNSMHLNEKQHNFLMELIRSYNKKTFSSKTYTQKYRRQMADPRVVSGFRPETKEIIYPLVIERSLGNRLWDLDGNKYIDALNGFGSCIFGHQPDFIKEALKNQIEHGYEIGPQHPLAGEVCELLCEFTHHDRAALCNTGSEAVLGAMRIARTITGRSLIVAFSGSYHGINDEAIVRGSKTMETFPAAAGIQPGAVQNMLILEYGTEESLNIIRERLHELAAVLVEPVQSRRPEFQPVDFLKRVREITSTAETVLIFDEVITGFRMHPGGAQALFGIEADLATYGKVIGGGMPIGAILGRKKYMDALDGGFWQYGDASFPEIGVTYFAGTFVRHPLALAAAKASLIFLKEQGGEFQKKLTNMTELLATNLNSEFKKRKLPFEIKNFGSLWRLKFHYEIPYSELLFVLLREKGIHIWDGFPCFITAAYSVEDIGILEEAFVATVDELITAGFLPSNKIVDTPASGKKSSSVNLNRPPVKGAQLGRDENGNPAWFVADTEGKYIQIDLGH